MSQLDYPRPIAELLRQLPLAPLGPGRPQEEFRSSLGGVRSAFPQAADRDLVAACCAGLWLAFDFLDESHTISQGIDTVEGSYWHAILHRREPDASNSKYWWRRVGNHPLFAELAGEAAKLGWKTWDPAAFVDECEHERGTDSARELLLREVQLAEWRTLFAWCYRHALAM
jgi:hypothetical protein